VDSEQDRILDAVLQVRQAVPAAAAVVVERDDVGVGERAEGPDAVVARAVDARPGSESDVAEREEQRANGRGSPESDPYLPPVGCGSQRVL